MLTASVSRGEFPAMKSKAQGPKAGAASCLFVQPVEAEGFRPFCAGLEGDGYFGALQC